MTRLFWRSSLVAVALGAATRLVGLFAAEPETQDPMGPNGACYVCHMTFLKEPLSTIHLKAKVSCTKCHGPSGKHANDENIGATKPDILYKHEKVDECCKKCHDKHDAPAQKVIARYLERNLPPQTVPVCTDCHGSHKIKRAAEEQTKPVK